MWAYKCHQISHKVKNTNSENEHEEKATVGSKIDANPDWQTLQIYNK